MDFDVIFIAGPQGSGKGTQGRKLAERLGFLFWEMGKTLREVATEDTTLGRRVAVINQGVLLTDDVIIEVIKERLPVHLDESHGVIFDGVPRRIGQAEFLVQFLRERGKTKMAAIFIDLDREECIARLLKRALHEARLDDTPEIIETRFRYYDEVMKPTMDYLRKETTFMEIDGTPAMEEVSAQIDKSLGLSIQP